ncbi:MAG: dihydrofolate reductase [Acidobacteria bacterium]|nr:MAG: dihydrofolate reductase [Acidobacteriota bacterium]REK04125.1 MAG: dihydrofolate reductase [Acidobacteriota bacterium]REK15287.1 MAG: dihydrofolate reductase [Acidobacteriota bacterium]REK46377.1 MAG: dihydrofolate reductase [Acidobacteriota bacterium]
MKTSVFVGASADGFIARPDGSFDFLSAAGDEPHGFEEFFATVDALLMGRKTFEVVLPMEQWFYGDKPVFVYTSSELAGKPEGSVVAPVSGTPSEVFRSLEKRGFEHVYVDGAMTVQSFLNEGLIDHITVSLIPVLIGEGISLFGKVPNDIRLELAHFKEYPSGMVQITYDVTR